MRRFVALAAVAALAGCGPETTPVRVGSKRFTESRVLGELGVHLARHAGQAVAPRVEFGGSLLAWSALEAGAIDFYPEYTGTLAEEILSAVPIDGPEDLERELAARGLAMTEPLGFNNTYALGMLEERAEELGITRVSDLARHPDLALGFSNEFMSRADGWPGLRDAYGLPQADVRGLDHDVAYRALESGALDAMDLYSTDAEIRYYGLRVLEDDRGYFPRYDAMFVYREDLGARAPGLVDALEGLAGRIPRESMVAMNARAKLELVDASTVAADFLDELGIATESRARSLGSRLLLRTGEHLFMVLVSLFAAIAIAIPLGVVSARRERLGRAVLSVTGIIQTVPALALLVVMIPLLKLLGVPREHVIGAAPAILALFLYGLLPIVRNTYQGLTGIPTLLTESAAALGLAPGARLRLVELPLAAPAILAGIKTSAVINVGTATLGALIGAGGYGQPILTGITLDDTALILEGAIPAAVLAIGVQGLFDLIERHLVPPGTR